jgi:hypothetical protein
MRFLKEFVIVISALWLAFTFGCGGGGGGSDSGSSGTGTISMSMTDAKPMLPETSGKTITNVFVTIDDVLVHSPGGGWLSLASKMVENPYTIDLLQFTEGVTTEFVPPVPLGTGKYTQIRLSVQSARLRFDNNKNDEVEITVPSENLKTDKNFEFEVPEAKNNGDGNPPDPAAVDITIDFDLSKSLVLEGSEYKLKPVLHIVETADAATIEGFIANSAFPAAGYVIISVLDSTGQEYTAVQVDMDTTPGATETSYAIFWLVPDQAYTIQINYNPGQDDDPATGGVQDNYDDSAVVPPGPNQDYPNGTLEPGDIYQLDFSLAG